MDKCKGITKSGTRCSNKAESDFCGIHKKCYKKPLNCTNPENSFFDPYVNLPSDEVIVDLVEKIRKDLTNNKK